MEKNPSLYKPHMSIIRSCMYPNFLNLEVPDPNLLCSRKRYKINEQKTNSFCNFFTLLWICSCLLWYWQFDPHFRRLSVCGQRRSQDFTLEHRSCASIEAPKEPMG